MEKKTLQSFFQHLPSERELMDKIERRIDLWETFKAWTAEQQRVYLDRCTGKRGLNVLYDAYFKEVMNPEYAPARLESFLEAVIGERVKILKQLPNDGVRLEDENTLLVSDIVVELTDGSIANVEVQKIGYKFTGPRCSSYLSDMMLRQYKRLRAKRKKAFSYGDRLMRWMTRSSSCKLRKSNWRPRKANWRPRKANWRRRTSSNKQKSMNFWLNCSDFKQIGNDSIAVGF